MQGALEDELLLRARGRIGRVLCNDYRLDRVLGVGGMAAVYAAMHRSGRKVAVKVLHPELAFSRDARLRFLREGETAKAVKHPGVPEVLDENITDDGLAFIVMELLEGHVIEQLWETNGRTLSARTVLAIGSELC